MAVVQVEVVQVAVLQVAVVLWRLSGWQMSGCSCSGGCSLDTEKVLLSLNIAAYTNMIFVFRSMNCMDVR